MKNHNKINWIFIIGIFLLLLITPISFGQNQIISNHEISDLEAISHSFDNSSDHFWPMFCHDARHTGRSPFSTIENFGTCKWKFYIEQGLESSAAIDKNGIIYVGSNGNYLYAIYPNGNEKWRFDCHHWITSSPAISENGTVYACSWDDYLYAINPDGTQKWRIDTGGTIKSSPVIGENDIIYFGILGPGTNNGRIYAINPNGTEKWYFDTENYIFTSPAIGIDGSIYAASSDNHLYALNLNNGTLKWKFKMDDWPGSPAIANDGTIYISSQDDYFYALYLNGTLKWKCKIGRGSLHTPSIATDGTIYIGEDELYAINPNGTIKWTFYPGNEFYISSRSQAISAEGTIYFGVTKGTSRGDIIALNSDGTQKWRVEGIANDWVYSSPSIGYDGTVYIGSKSGPAPYGYLHAFGLQDTNEPPNAPAISGSTTGKVGLPNPYLFSADDPDNNPVSFYIDWDDNSSGWTREYSSNENANIKHTWDEKGNYTIKVKAKDSFDEESVWSEFEIKISNPRTRTWVQFLDMFPILQRILAFLKSVSYTHLTLPTN